MKKHVFLCFYLQINVCNIYAAEWLKLGLSLWMCRRSSQMSRVSSRVCVKRLTCSSQRCIDSTRSSVATRQSSENLMTKRSGVRWQTLTAVLLSLLFIDSHLNISAACEQSCWISVFCRVDLAVVTWSLCICPFSQVSVRSSDVKRGQNLAAEAEAEAKTSRLCPQPRGQGQSYESEANFWRLRPRLRPKIIMKKVSNND